MTGVLSAEVAFPKFPTLDPYGPNTTLLLHGDGATGAQNNIFIDSSPNIFSITRNGNTTQGTFSPFSQPNGYWSNYFNGSGDTIFTQDNAAFNLANSAFTIEMFIFMTAYSNYGLFCGQWAGGTSTTAYAFRQNNAKKLQFVYTTNGTTEIPITGTTDIPLNSWVHICVCRDSSNNWALYLNGSRDAISTASDTIYDAARIFQLGAGGGSPPLGDYFTGYISNLRFVKGSTVYNPTQLTLTIPTSPLTAVANTQLLTCQSNRFVDNSTNAFAITANGTPSVQAFHPISAPTAYYPAVNGGAGYFDGSGDYLSAPSSSVYDMGSGDFTIEFWVYRLTSSDNAVFHKTDPAGDTPGLSARLWSGKLNFDVGVSNSWSGAVTVAGSTTIPLYSWTHCACVRSGNNFYVFVNGVLDGSTTSSITAYYNASQNVYIGLWRNGDPAYLNAHLSNLRVVKGGALYTSTFTPPTSPFTTTVSSGTVSLLLSYTNAGIIDSVSQNALETVGNAQVSTTQSKFGGASMSFDGNGDYLVTPASANLGFGSSDFTIEMWFYTNSVINSYPFLATNRSDGAWNANAWQLFDRHTSYNTKITFWIYNNSNSVPTLTSATSISNSNWYHVAVSRSGNTFSLFINGNLESTATYSGAVDAGNQLIAVGGSSTGTTSYNGYIDDLRITKGIARYTQNFTPPQNAYPDYGPLTNIPTVDPAFNYNTVLLHGNGTDGTQNNTFIDSSSNGFSITRNGNTTQGTFTPFSQPNGWWSNYFNGSTDYLSFTSNATTIGTGDFTIETWICPGSQPSTYSTIIGGSVSGTPLFNINGTGTATTISLNAYGSANAISASITFAIGVWCHIAVSRSGTSLRLFVNGSQVASATDSTNFTQAIKIIGSAGAGNQLYAGYVSNARVVVGTAIYTSNFTPSTLPLTAVTNTNVLTCQSSNFKDNSSNAFAITPSGTPSVQNRYPFFPPLDYSTAAIGGSGYFDGSGDYLDTPSSTQFALGSNDFTIEGWIYWDPTKAADRVFIDFRPALTNGAYPCLYINSSGQIVYYTVSSDRITSSSISAYSWTFFSLNRYSGTTKLYISGTQSGSSYTDSNVYLQSRVRIGNNGYDPTIGGDYKGYISNIRIVNGTAVYTSAFTPPTAPLTAITNTSLLLSCTNAGIFDNASKNDLETVGSTMKISTTTSKYGGSSMSFNGSTDYLKLPYQNTAFGTGDFTVEAWVYITQQTTQNNILDTRSSAGGANPFLFSISATNAYLWYYTGTAYYTTSSVPLNTWTHVAISRSSGTVRMFINGVQGYSGTDTSNMTGTSTTTVNIGTGGPLTGWFTGNINDLRITVGYSRYNYNFTPPLALLPNK